MFHKENLRRILAGAFFLMLCASIITTLPVWAQKENEVQHQIPVVDDAALLLSHDNFESWIEKQVGTPNSSPKALAPLSYKSINETLLQRLRRGKRTTDKSILLNIYNVYRHSVLMQPLTDGAVTGASLAETKTSVLSILPLLQKRGVLTGQLYGWLSYLAQEEGNIPAATTYFKQSAQFYKITDYPPEQGLLVLTQLGMAYREINPSSPAAEGFYSKIVKTLLPWPEGEGNPEMSQRVYCHAGLELISIRQGNLKALEQTTFFHFSKEVLLPKLAAAIRAAGGQVDNIDHTNFYAEGLEKIVRQRDDGNLIWGN